MFSAVFGTSLEFAAGTTDDCKRLVAGLFQPGDVLAAYREARRRLGTADVVLVAAEYDASGFEATARRQYVARLREGLRDGNRLVSVLGIAQRSAREVASLPRGAEAFWLVVNRRQALPVMVVLFAAPYAMGGDAREPSVAN